MFYLFDHANSKCYSDGIIRMNKYNLNWYGGFNDKFSLLVLSYYILGLITQHGSNKFLTMIAFQQDIINKFSKMQVMACHSTMMGTYRSMSLGNASAARFAFNKVEMVISVSALLWQVYHQLDARDSGSHCMYSSVKIIVNKVKEVLQCLY